MRLKKVISLFLTGVVAMSFVGCGSSSKTAGTNDQGNGKIVVWTLSEDLKTFADYYMEKNPGKEVEVNIIAPADYSTKLTTALKGKAETPDVMVGEPQMLGNFFEAGFFEDLTKEPYKAEQYKNDIVDYVYKAGSDQDGKVRALSYQMTPGGITYRRDIAKTVWGNDDPEFIHAKFKDMATIITTANELKAKGYRIFADTGDLNNFVYGIDPQPWVKDNKLMMTQDRLNYVDAAVKLYQDKLVAFAPAWSPAWYASMNGPIPLEASTQKLEDIDANAAKTEVFSYALPTWGTLIIRDNAKDKIGNFGITTGPNSYFQGGTFLGINSYSKNKEAAWDFIKFVTLNKETSQWWIEKSKGDVVSYIPTLEANKDMANEAFGGQKTYDFWLKESKNVDYSLVTKYDDQLKNLFGQSVEAIQKGQMTKEEALKDFYKNVKTVYPDIVVPE